MDVNELAPALLSVSDLFREANQTLNREHAQVSVRVKADFSKGSFEVALLLDQSLLEHAKNLLFSQDVANARTLVEVVFGTGIAATGVIGAVNSVLELWKKLKGDKPKDVIDDQSKGITIIQTGEGQINVNSKAAQLYRNDKIRASISGALRPVTRPGIRSFDIRKGKKLIDRVTKRDLPVIDPVAGMLAAMEVGGNKLVTESREAVLRVTRANFEKGKWGFSDGNATFSADITDAAFKEDLDNRRIGFYKGDLLKVVLTTKQVISTERIFQTKYVIEQVLEHTHGFVQQSLPKG
jgi:hypothetical protein